MRNTLLFLTLASCTNIYGDKPSPEPVKPSFLLNPSSTQSAKRKVETQKFNQPSPTPVKPSFLLHPSSKQLATKPTETKKINGPCPKPVKPSFLTSPTESRIATNMWNPKKKEVKQQQEAIEPEPPKPQDNAFTRPLIEAKAGYFFFESEKMQDVYDQGGFDVQIAGSYPILKWFSVRGSVEYAEKSGHLATGEKTSIYLVPISLGFQFNIPIIRYFNAYASLGPRYVFVRQHNHSSHLPSHVAASDLGMYANAGFLGMLPCRLTFDVFAEYSYAKVHFDDSTSINVLNRATQVGGFAFGAGIGYSF